MGYFRFDVPFCGCSQFIMAVFCMEFVETPGGKTVVVSFQSNAVLQVLKYKQNNTIIKIC